MLTTDPSSLSVIFGLAAVAGVTHTLAGPDHYLPLVAIARERRWSATRASLIASGFGVLHCLASVALVFCLALSAELTQVLASTAAWMMVGIGCGILIFAMRRRRDSARSSGRGRAIPVLLGAAFLVGPCEWLIPVATTTLSSLGAAAALLVCAVYSACTVATMWLATLVGAYGLARLAPDLSGRAGGVICGAVCAGCGALMVLGF